MFRLVVWSCLVLLTGLPAEIGDFCWFCVRADTRASAQKRPSAKYAIAWLTGISRPNIGHALCIQSRNRKFSWVYFGVVCRTSPSLIRPRYMRLEPRGQEQKASEAKWTQRSAEAAETERRKKERIPKQEAYPTAKPKLAAFENVEKIHQAPHRRDFPKTEAKNIHAHSIHVFINIRSAIR